MESIVGVDQLRRDPDAIAGFADTAFDNVNYTQGLGDVRNVSVLPFESEPRRACDDSLIRYLDQQVDDLFRQTVGEVFVVHFVAQIGERQHLNGKFRVSQ